MRLPPSSHLRTDTNESACTSTASRVHCANRSERAPRPRALGDVTSVTSATSVTSGTLNPRPYPSSASNASRVAAASARAATGFPLAPTSRSRRLDSYRSVSAVRSPTSLPARFSTRRLGTNAPARASAGSPNAVIRGDWSDRSRRSSPGNAGEVPPETSIFLTNIRSTRLPARFSVTSLGSAARCTSADASRELYPRSSSTSLRSPPAVSAMDAADGRFSNALHGAASLRRFGSDVARMAKGWTGRTSASRPRALSPTSSTTRCAAKMARSRAGPRRAKSPPEHVACVHSAASVARHLAKMARESSVLPRKGGGVFRGGSGVLGIDARATFASPASLASSAASSETTPSSSPASSEPTLASDPSTRSSSSSSPSSSSFADASTPTWTEDSFDPGRSRGGTRSSPSASASMTGSSDAMTTRRARAPL